MEDRLHLDRAGFHIFLTNIKYAVLGLLPISTKHRSGHRYQNDQKNRGGPPRVSRGSPSRGPSNGTGHGSNRRDNRNCNGGGRRYNGRRRDPGNSYHSRYDYDDYDSDF